MRFLALHTSKLLVVIALICAMASTGFAHRLASQPLDPALAIYLAEGGSLTDICGDTSGDPHQNAQSCEACRLVSAAVLPDHDPVCAATYRKPTVALPPVHDIKWHASKRDLSRAPRGPPTV